MLKKVLVTTALTESWSRSEPMLFLGDWCKFNSKINSNKYNISIFKNHYCADDYRVYENYKYISKLYENLLLELTKTLNNYHDTNFSKRYWRIILGPWLCDFITIVYDRWCTLKKINYNKDVLKTYLLNITEKNISPTDIEEFDIFKDHDVWNHFIFSEILKVLSPKKLFVKKNFKFKKLNSYFKKKRVGQYSFYNQNNYLFKNQKIFIKDTYLKFKNEILLSSLLFSQPTIPSSRKMKLNIKKNFNRGCRENLNLDYKEKNLFEKFVINLIKIQLPQIYLESFNEINKFVENSPWPKNPKVIFTSNMLWNVTSHIFYIANKVEKKTKLIYGQHGGVYGQFKYNFGQEHEIKCSDEYLTWGWRNASRNVVPFGIIKNISLNDKSKNKGKIITIINRGLNRYSINHQPDLSYTNKINNFKSVGSILQNLKKKIPNKYLKIRDTYEMYQKGWDIKKILSHEIKKIKYDNGKSSIENEFRNTCLFIIPVNSTTFLETLNGNYPTLIYFKMNKKIYKKEALKLINELKKAKIFHSSIASLTYHANKIWPDVNKWWFSKKTQKAVSIYCSTFAKSNDNKIIELRKIIKKYL